MPVKDKPNAFGLQTKTSEHIEPVPANKQMIDLRKLTLNESGSAIIQEVISAALDKEHPSHTAMLKACFDRLLPVSEFEKMGGQGRPAITINIGGINDAVTIEGEKSEV